MSKILLHDNAVDPAAPNPDQVVVYSIAGEIYRRLPDGSIYLLGSGLAQDTLAAGKSLTIHTTYQLVVFGQYHLDGCLTLEGKLVIL